MLSILKVILLYYVIRYIHLKLNSLHFEMKHVMMSVIAMSVYDHQRAVEQLRSERQTQMEEKEQADEPSSLAGCMHAKFHHFINRKVIFSFLLTQRSTHKDKSHKR